MANLALIKVLENIAPSIASSVKKYSVGKEYDKLANDIRSFKEIKDKELTEVTNIYNDLLEKKAPEEQISLAKIKKDQLEMETKQYAVNPVAQMFLAGNYPRSDEEFQRSLSLFNLVRGQGTTTKQTPPTLVKNKVQRIIDGKLMNVHEEVLVDRLTKNREVIYSEAVEADYNENLRYALDTGRKNMRQAWDMAMQNARIQLADFKLDNEDYDAITRMIEGKDADKAIVDYLSKKGSIATEQRNRLASIVRNIKKNAQGFLKAINSGSFDDLEIIINVSGKDTSLME